MSTDLKNKLRFILCLGGSVLFVSLLVYSMIFEPLWAALMGTGMLGMGCVSHSFHDLRKPELKDYDPLTFA